MKSVVFPEHVIFVFVLLFWKGKKLLVLVFFSGLWHF